MSEELFIERHKSDQRPDSFASLRRVGIELAQQFCGECWTDFNLHDPGVTILEQLAYAITELIYRADFATADLLSGEESIKYTRHALYEPKLIFPCRPTTLLDYRKTLLNALSELDNCWLQPLSQADGADGSYQGLYKILLKPHQGMAEGQRESLEDKVRHQYQQHRNLCEDLAEVCFVQDVDYTLCAQIEVSSARRPVEILAEIYVNCARRVAGSVRFQDYHQTSREGRSLEEIFTGPFTDKGLLVDEELIGERQAFQISSLSTVVNQIEGVEQIAALHLERQRKVYYDTVECNISENLNLQIPQHHADVKVRLTTNGRILNVEMEELMVRIEKLNFRYYSTRSMPQELSLLYNLPVGSSRQVTEYFSIQEQFPATYGVGHLGVPESAAPEVKGRAKQLKSYLLIFEQIMANFLANLDAIPSLFSIDKEHRNSYSFMALNNKQIPDLDTLYKDKHEETLARIVAEFDDYHERKNRLLDYLLALYGESFSQHSLRHFNYYYHQHAVEDRILENKIDYLEAIVELGRDRAAAGNTGGVSWNERTLSGLQRRVAMLLDFRHAESRSLVFRLNKEGLTLMPHKRYEQHFNTSSIELRFITIDEREDREQGRLFSVPIREEVRKFDLMALRKQIGDAIPLNNKLLSDLLLREGIYLDRYKLFRHKPQDDFLLCFRSGEGQYWYLGCYPDNESGILAANALCLLLIHLNSESEGLHLLEHILLRPLGCSRYEGLNLPTEVDFFSFRASVVFPAWTARCHDPQFRLLAEETVRLNAPAHIFVEFYWLEFDEMEEFESLYEIWLDMKSKKQADSMVLNQHSCNLIDFLLEIKKEGMERESLSYA